MTAPLLPRARAATAWRFLIRSLSKRASKFGLVLLAVTVGVSIVAAGWTLSADLEKKLSVDLREEGANALILPEPRPGMPMAPWVDPTPAVRLALAATPGAVAAPILYVPADSDRGGLTVAGVDFPVQSQMSAVWEIQGAWPGGSDTGACVAGRRLATRLGAAPGARVTVRLANGEELTCALSGVATSGEAADEMLFASLGTLRRAAGTGPVVSAVALRIPGTPAEASATVASLGAAAPGGQARVLHAAAASERRFLERIARLTSTLGTLVVVLAGLCIMTTLMAIVVEREPEIALMRSLGGSDAGVVLMILGEAALLGAAGGLLGWGLGGAAAWALGPGLFSLQVTPRLGTLPEVILLALLLCCAGVLWPLRRALSVRPAIALKGE